MTERSAEEIRRLQRELLDPILDRFNKHFPAGFDREKLAAILDEEPSISASQHWADEVVGRCTLHKIAPELARVLKELDRPRHWDIAIAALNDGNWFEAELRFGAWLRDLRKIIAAVPPAPRRGRGKPPKTKNLHALVDRLATFWEQETDEPFRQSWHKDKSGESDWHLNPTTKRPEKKWPLKPATESAAFVHDVVTLVSPRLLRLLPKVTEKVVSERRKRRVATSAK
jgi:hypothetical protein